MQDLRLIGVHEDGLHLILGDEDGNRYRVELDEPLRVAARRDRPRLGQLQIELDGGLRPREVQALIRSGLSSEEVADRAGWTVDKVRRYEGPVLAEREHVAALARAIRLRPRGGQGVSGSSPTLGHRVSERLHLRQLDPNDAAWDSHKIDGSVWAVIVRFVAGGQERRASWEVDVRSGTLVARDDEARWLSEDEVAPEGPLVAPHLRDDRPTAVYDVEAEGGVAAPRRRRGSEPIDLAAAMRERSAARGRSRRRKPAAHQAPGIENAPDEALPLENLAMSLEDAGPPPAAHDREPVPEELVPEELGDEPDDNPEPELDPHSELEPETTGPEATEPQAIAEPEPEPEPNPAQEPDPAAPADREPSESAEASSAASTESTETTASIATDEPRPAPRKSGRPSVPSWDDVMFGRKGT